MATIVSRALMVLFLVLGLRVSRAESTESSATPEASKRPAFDNSKPQILIRRPFEKLNGVEYWSSGHPGYDCERNGVVMFGFVFFEGGTWHDAYGFSPSKQPYGDNFFMRMVDPSGKYHPAGEAVVKAIGSTEGRAVLFRDMECEPKPTGKWWQDYEVLISKPAWCSPSRPAASPPAVEELAGRMKREMAAEEEKERRECEQYPSLSADCDQEPYNPSKLAAPKLVEAAEFDIAPGETVFFVQLCRCRCQQSQRGRT